MPKIKQERNITRSNFLKVVVIALFGVLLISGLSISMTRVAPTGIESARFFEELIYGENIDLVEYLRITVDIYGADDDYELSSKLFGGPDLECISEISSNFQIADTEWDDEIGDYRGYAKIILDFEAGIINASGIDGSYTLDICIKTVHSNTEPYFDTYITDNYSACEFAESMDQEVIPEADLDEEPEMIAPLPASVGSVEPALAGGYYHNLFLNSDGTVWAWGRNQNGQIGDNSTVNRTKPVNVSGLSNVAAIAAGLEHSLALKDSGEVWAWGRNDCGQIGDNSTVDRKEPVQVAGINNVIAIAAGFYHTIALKADGTVWGWGANDFGKLGDSANPIQTNPVQVNGLNNVVAIATGSHFSLALKSDGTVWSWGRNDYGQLGDNGNTNRSTPAKVDGLSNIVAIKTGTAYCFAIEGNGTTWAWGYNMEGQLGIGTIGIAKVPGQVNALHSKKTVVGGGGHSLALEANGQVYAWGNNAYGQIGDNSNTNRYTPELVSSISGVIDIDTGCYHSLALKSDGTLWAWGYNAYGQLGNNSITSSNVPVQVQLDFVVEMPTAYPESPHPYTNNYDNIWTYTHPITADSLAITFSSDTKTEANYDKIYIIDNSGNNIPGSPFSGTSLANQTKMVPGNSFQIRLTTDISVVDYGFRIIDIEALIEEQLETVEPVLGAGGYHSILLNTDTTVWAWGYNNYGQLGDGTNTKRANPEQVQAAPNNPLVNIKTIAAGCYHNLAIKSNSTVWAWGYNTYGQLGNGSNTDSKVPVQVTGLSNIEVVSAGFYHSLAIKSDGTVWAWGNNNAGQLGNNSTSSSNIPVQVKDTNNNPLTNVVAIATGDDYSLALKSDGTVWAWGWNGYGQLGDNSTTNSKIPVQVKDSNNSPLTNIVAITAGYYHSLALKSDGTVWAWGRNNNGQLGNNSKTDSIFPIQVNGLANIKAVASKYSHSIALNNAGQVYTWGYNSNGQLGDNTNIDKLIPILVNNITNVTKIETGHYHSLALKTDGTLWAWGCNQQGQLGKSPMTDSFVPIQVQLGFVVEMPTIYPESDHPYSNNFDYTWTYTHPMAASSLAITFSSDTKTEANYDKIYIMDNSGNNIPGSPFSGTSLANQTKTVPGNSFQIRLTTDVSVVDYGFRITSIEAVNQPTGSKTLSLSPNKEYSIPFVVQGLDSIASKTFKLTYDPVKLDIVDLAAQTKPLITTVGLVAGTDVNILSHSNGVITFKVNKILPAGIPWTGTLNIFKFKAKSTASGSTDITCEVI